MKESFLHFVFFSGMFLVIFLFGCGTTPQLPAEVCEYTTVICDYSDLICQYYPESCAYVEIACLNFAVLCSDTSSQQQKDISLIILNANNKLLQKEFEELKEK